VEIHKKQTSTNANGNLNGKEVSKELKIWPWENLCTWSVS